ncbi:unnamed protein product [Blepharisma stoltei]|uniref:Uncharacterized protein n=1 Tax=Blepharisma stoltei TaxID=1481888 RepID=A0AAU9JYA4_9CILI|nr:unnamed protein product [Blepharisma stoltei]
MSKTSLRSPYSLSPRDSKVSFFRQTNSEGLDLFNAFVERKKVTEHLISMQNRIKQLEKEEQKTQKKIDLAKQHIDSVNELKNRKRKEKADKKQYEMMKMQQLETLRQRNNQKRLENKEIIMKHKGIVLEERKRTVRELKDFLTKQKRNSLGPMCQNNFKELSSTYNKSSVESSPGPSRIKEKLSDEKTRTIQNWTEIKALKEREKELLSRLEMKTKLQEKYLQELKSVVSSKT